MTRSGRLIEYGVAFALACAAAAVSPRGIALAAGRADLSFRVTTISMAFALFLLILAIAAATQGRLRRASFYAAALAFPFVLLAGLEAGAVSLRLADVVAPLEDTSALANQDPWPKHLLSESSYYTTPEGFVLYRPWQNGHITFNALGLRTAMPSPKKPGEWRVAISGGSAAWGWRVIDNDTIAVVLQDILRKGGHDAVTVYNFGIGGATLKRELELVEHFRAAYDLDQVLFYTGANDVFSAYIGGTNDRYGPWVGTTVSFELIKTLVRLQAVSTPPAASTLQWLDEAVLPAALRNNTLRTDIAAADAYCRGAKLVCDFALQPMMFDRPAHPGAEARMAETLGRIYPRMDVLARQMYRDAVASGPAGRVFDLSDTFTRATQPLFLDTVHLNEAGNRIVAERLAPIVIARVPQPRS